MVAGKGIVLPDIGLALPGVVTVGPQNPDGRLITALAPAWFEIVRMLSKNRQALYQINWRTLEEIIAGAYSRAGFEEVTLTPRSADGGRDVIAVKRGYCTVRILDSVKAYGPGRKVSAEEVRALWGVVDLEHASKGVLSTTADFAPGILRDPLLRDLMPNRLELINGSLLVDRLIDLARSK